MAETDGVTFLSHIEHVYIRPSMYFGSRGSKGVLYLFEECIVEIIKLLQGQQPEFTITIKDSRTFQIYVRGRFDIEQFTSGLIDQDCLLMQYLYILPMPCEEIIFSIATDVRVKELCFNRGVLKYNVEKEQNDFDGLKIDFELSDLIFNEYPDYHDFGSLCSKLAMLNKETTFSLQDNYDPHLNKNFYQFPEGIKWLFDRKCAEKENSTVVAFIDEHYKGNYYQIGIAYHNYQFGPNTFSYAGNNVTVEDGSLVNGTLLGFMNAFAKYKATIDPLDLEHLVHKNNKARFLPNLLLVCIIRSDSGEYGYGGSTKHKLEMPQVQKDVKKLVCDKVSEALCNDPELGNKLKFWFY